MKLSGDIWGKTRTAVMMAMPADGVRVRLMSDVRTCSTRERLTPRDKEQSQRRQSVHLGARNPAGGATGLDLGKVETPVAFAAGAGVGLQRRGARGGAHLVMSQHSRPAQPDQPLRPAPRPSWPRPARREAGPRPGGSRRSELRAQLQRVRPPTGRQTLRERRNRCGKPCRGAQRPEAARLWRRRQTASP